MSTIELAVGRLHPAPASDAAGDAAAVSASWSGLQTRLTSATARLPPEIRAFTVPLCEPGTSARMFKSRLAPRALPGLAPSVAPGLGRVAEISVLSALIGAALIWAILVLQGRPAVAGNADSSERVAAAPGAQAAGMRVMAPQPVVAGQAATGAATLQAHAVEAGAGSGLARPPDVNDVAQARTLVQQWARAWSDRDVERYLGFYADSFTPDKGVARGAWEANRRKRLQSPLPISVAVRDLRIEAAGGDRAIARFAQDYAAGDYRESGTPKILLLARRTDGWRIVAELAP